jgi:hypothetical protein
VYVIPAVTADARARHRFAVVQFYHWFRMAGFALDPAVRAIETETGFVVIEIPTLPGARIVARFTIGAEAALVHVLLLVTRVA